MGVFNLQKTEKKKETNKKQLEFVHFFIFSMCSISVRNKTAAAAP
jgi:hypothetical protein